MSCLNLYLSRFLYLRIIFTSPEFVFVQLATKAPSSNQTISLQKISFFLGPPEFDFLEESYVNVHGRDEGKVDDDHDGDETEDDDDHVGDEGGESDDQAMQLVEKFLCTDDKASKPLTKAF